MKLILFLPAAGLLFSGAMRLDKLSSNPTSPSARPAMETVARMWANSKTLYKGEILRLHFSTPHPQYLGVIDPDGHFYYVVFPKENESGGLKPLVSSERFATMKSLKINTTTFKADPYEYGVLANRAVFTKTGTYRFVLGDNLHVDDHDALTILKVRYTHSARPLPVTDIAAID